MEASQAAYYTGMFVLNTLLLLFLKYLWKVRKVWDILNRLPGPKPWPIFGNVNELGYLSSSSKIFNPIIMLQQTRTGMGLLFRKEKLFRFWVGWRPVVILTGAETVEPLLKSNTLLDKGEFYKTLEPWLGNGLLLSRGDVWKRHRKLLTPTFHFRILDNFLIVMNEQAEILVRKLAEASKEKDWIDVLHYLSMCALDIICETAMGIRIGAQEDKDSEYLKTVTEFLTENAKRIMKPWLRFNFIFDMSESGRKTKKLLKTLHEFTESVIRERMSEKRISPKIEDLDSEVTLGKRKLAFLDLLLGMNEKDINPKEIREQVDTFMFAGHDTTSTTLSWAFYLLGWHPQIQSRLVDELDQVFGEDRTRQVTEEDMKQLKYMDCVMKECQRIYPSVPGFSRKLSEDTMTGGYLIPKGTTVAVNIYLVHHDPDVYPDPEVFDPDRFLPENSAGRNPYAFIPFSAGARNCIGQRYALMEEKVVLCHVLRNFRVTSLDPRDKILLLPAAVLRTDGPLRVSFQPRTFSYE